MKTITLKQGLESLAKVRKYDFVLPPVTKEANATMEHCVKMFPKVIAAWENWLNDESHENYLKLKSVLNLSQSIKYNETNPSRQS